MNANRLKTTERKIEWLKNEIKDLEYVLSDDCINRNLKLCMLQMYREHLDMLEKNFNSAESNPPPKPVAFFDHRNEPDCTMEYQVYDKQEADAYIHWLEQKAGIL